MTQEQLQAEKQNLQNSIKSMTPAQIQARARIFAQRLAVLGMASVNATPQTPEQRYTLECLDICKKELASRKPSATVMSKARKFWPLILGAVILVFWFIRRRK